MQDSPDPSTLNKSVILACVSPQDDATVKCWGRNAQGELGLGDTENRGDGANGLSPSRSPNESFMPVQYCSHSCSCSPRAEMGEKLPSVDLGPGRTAVAVSAGAIHTCALLVRPHSGRWGGREPAAQLDPTLKASLCQTSATAALGPHDVSRDPESQNLMDHQIDDQPAPDEALGCTSVAGTPHRQ